MLINSLGDAYYWLSLVNKAKDGDEFALEKIQKHDKENHTLGHPTIEDQLIKLQKGNNGSLISNNGIDWKNNGYKLIPEIESTFDAIRVFDYYYSIQDNKDFQSWDEITNKSLDGYIANIGYQLILDGKTLYEPWRNEMYKKLNHVFTQISEYYLKKTIAHLWTKKFNLSGINSKDNFYLIARRNRYSIFRFLDNEKFFYSFSIIWVLGLFFWLLYKDYSLGAALSFAISTWCGFESKNTDLSRTLITIIFFLLFFCCILITLSAYVEFLNHYGAEFAKYITIWSIIGLVSFPIFVIQEEKQKQMIIFAEDYK